MKTQMILLNKIVVASIFFLAPAILFSQGFQQHNQKKEQRERIEAHKIAFITDKLNLSPAEAEKFWPVYNSNKEIMKAEFESFREKIDFTPQDIQKLSDEEALAFLDSQQAHEQKMLKLKISFSDQLKSILPPQKILRLIEAEREFKVELMRKVSELRNAPPQRMYW
ncbi:MAG: hypothetical protein K8S16_15500 [Bacteroidales bacterium]|nr:hypothetical protein [Bacteroidales bacterium]